MLGGHSVRAGAPHRGEGVPEGEGPSPCPKLTKGTVLARLAVCLAGVHQNLAINPHGSHPQPPRMVPQDKAPEQGVPE